MLYGATGVKAARKYVGEIDPWLPLVIKTVDAEKAIPSLAINIIGKGR